MTDILPTVDLKRIAFARLDEYFGLWAIEPMRGMGMLRQASEMNLVEHVQVSDRPTVAASMEKMKLAIIPVAGSHPPENDSIDEESLDEEVTAEKVPHITCIHLVGTLMKQCSSFDDATSTVAARKLIRTAIADPMCMGILFCVDSPGGTVAGAFDLADEVTAAAAAKPCLAFCEDLCASAAYLVTSGCPEIYANHATSQVGSIGTIIATYDYSEACAKEGIQAKIYATGELKGAGFPGAKITPAQDAYFQKIVDDTQVHFAAYVSKGRKMSTADVKKVATGGVFNATEATLLGLIDGIKSYDECVARMNELIKLKSIASGTLPAAHSDTPQKEASMSAPNTPDGKAFVSAFGPKGAVRFVEGKTFEEAAVLHKVEVEAEVAALKSENVTLRTENQTLNARVIELRGSDAPASADVSRDADAKNGGDKNITSLEARIGKNMAKVASSILLPKSK